MKSKRDLGKNRLEKRVRHGGAVKDFLMSQASSPPEGISCPLDAGTKSKIF